MQVHFKHAFVAPAAPIHRQPPTLTKSCAQPPQPPSVNCPNQRQPPPMRRRTPRTRSIHASGFDLTDCLHIWDNLAKIAKL